MSYNLKVRDLRKEKKIPALDFAKMCGQTSRQWTYKLERGDIKRIPKELFSKFAEILQVPESYFTDDKDEVVEQDTDELFTPDAEGLYNIEGYKDRYLFLLLENRKLMAENIRLKNQIIKHGIL